jgi:hypothetical protein
MVGHDQEVARETHLGDDPDFPLKTRPVVLFRRRRHDLLQARLQTLLGLVHQLVGLAAPVARVEARQDGRVGLDQEGAAFGDLDRRVAGLGQVREQGPHLGGGLEEMLVRNPAAILLTREGAVGDAQQGVMRLRLALLGVIDVVGRRQGRIMGIGPFHQTALGRRLVRETVTLEFDIEAVAEHLRHCGQGLGGFLGLVLGEQGIDRSIRPARQEDQPVGVSSHPLPRHVGLLVARLEVGH